MRRLRKEHPDLWALMLKWDDACLDSNGYLNGSHRPIKFQSNGRTVHDYERRFTFEDEGYLPAGKRFRWDDLDAAQMNVFQFIPGGEK